MKRYMERFESWTETHRQMRKIVEDFERIAERLGRRINEVAEMQRLSEERFRQEWNDWVADDQKRWKQFTVTNDEAWRNENKQLEALRQRVEEEIGRAAGRERGEVVVGCKGRERASCGQ